MHRFVVRGLANGLTCRAEFGCGNPGLGCEVVVPEAICRCSEDPFQVRLCEVLADWLACLSVVATHVLRVRGQSVLKVIRWCHSRVAEFPSRRRSHGLLPLSAAPGTAIATQLCGPVVSATAVGAVPAMLDVFREYNNSKGRFGDETDGN